jgi:ABC-type amino acid transport substrate-binding protein
MKKHLVPFLLGLIVALLLVILVQPRTTEETQTAHKESTYDRIMRTRTIRCGYFVWPPFLTKDINTGELSGIYVDYMNAFAAVSDLKIEWAQELNFATYLQDLENGRYDMEVGGWQNAKRGQHVFYAEPYAYIPLVAIVRKDDTRFDKDPAGINHEEIRVATIDGEKASMFRQLRFPQSRNISLPQNSTFADPLVNVITGKADVAFTDTLTANVILKENEEKIKIINYDPPLDLILLSVSIPPEPRLKQMVDTANRQILSTGAMKKVFEKYDPNGKNFLLPTASFAQH